MAFELSIFDNISSESKLTYGRTKIFLSLFEPKPVFDVLNVISDLCTNNFFNLKLILLNIRSRGSPLSSNNFMRNLRFFSWNDECDSLIARSTKIANSTHFVAIREKNVREK